MRLLGLVIYAVVVEGTVVWKVLIPRLRAALSHVAISVIAILPDTEPHEPLLTLEKVA